jgi:hypothetical protein
MAHFDRSVARRLEEHYSCSVHSRKGAWGWTIVRQGDVELLDKDPVAHQLLESAIPARFSYNWTDGTPRVVPINFRYTGGQIVMGTPPKAPKIKALRADPHVAITIDDTSFPYKVLSIRGTAEVVMKDDVDEDYAAAAERYLGEEAGRAWVAGLRGKPMARIAVQPSWVGILDFETRFPSALSL